MSNREGLEVAVFWTGGWDSTFRVLSLVTDYPVIVRPYYLFDEGRKSAHVELEVMRGIRSAVNDRGSAFEGTIGEVEIRNMGMMRNSPDIHDALLEIRRTRHCGWQYYPLASVARQENLWGIELALVRQGMAEEGSLSAVLGGMVEQFDSKVGTSYRMSDKYRERPEYAVFSRFSFPLMDVSKDEMRMLSEIKGFLDLMETTWFCHYPLSDGSPCGTCNPCIVSIREGMGYRVPLKARLRYRTRGARRMVWALKKKIRRLFLG